MGCICYLGYSGSLLAIYFVLQHLFPSPYTYCSALSNHWKRCHCFTIHGIRVESRFLSATDHLQKSKSAARQGCFPAKSFHAQITFLPLELHLREDDKFGWSRLVGLYIRRRVRINATAGWADRCGDFGQTTFKAWAHCPNPLGRMHANDIGSGWVSSTSDFTRSRQFHVNEP